ncbi:MAG: MoaD/ThiS family protein [Thermodesulfobacteria bacterium]|nr:MoaD/ThiS family protein [Thermodesulfobacteriota bacterium]
MPPFFQVMKVKVKLFTLLRLEFGVSEVELEFEKEPVSLKEVLHELSKRFGEKFLSKLVENENLKVGTIILKNGKNVLELDGINTLVQDGDELSLFPPGGGG